MSWAAPCAIQRPRHRAAARRAAAESFGTAIGQGRLGDAVHAHRLLEHGLGDLVVLARRNGPSDDEAGEDVEYDVEVGA